MERREWKIYKRTNLVNGKVYIGQTKQRNWLDRIYQENYPSNKQVITYAVLKYGTDNFKNEIIEDKLYSQDDADRAEIKWIKHYDSCNPDKGYNKTHGGQGTGKEHIAGILGKPCVHLQKRIFFDSISELASYTGISHSHCWKVINRTNELYHYHGEYFMYLEEFEEFNSFEDAIKFIDELRKNKKKKLLDKYAEKREELLSNRYIKKLEVCSYNLSSALDMKFMVKNKIYADYLIKHGTDSLGLEEKWKEYIELAQLCLDSQYKKIFLGKIQDMSNEDIQKKLEVDLSKNRISTIWTTTIPEKISEFSKKIQVIQKAEAFKECSRCKRWKPMSNSYFSKNNTSKDGFYSMCKACRSKKDDVLYDKIFDEFCLEVKVKEYLRKLESHPQSRPSKKRFIQVIDLKTGAILGEHRTQKEVSEIYKISVAIVSGCCTNKIDSVNGLKIMWKV